MGTLIGHVAPGFGFLLIGLWHLFNNIKLHSLHPTTFTSPSWFPSLKIRHLELLIIIAGSLGSISMELFIGPNRHQPLDPDFTIPSNHLHNFEHSSISLSFLLFALLSILLDRSRCRQERPLSQLLAGLAFSQQLLMFHLHSSDHMGVEGQYHLLLQIVISVTLATTLIGIALPSSFTVGFVRSVSIALQGVWFIAMGYALWTPSLMPKGCFMNSEDGHSVVRCKDGESLSRAKSLVNIEFSYLLTGMAAFSVVVYLYLAKKYESEEKGYVSLEEEEDDGEKDLELQNKFEESDSFVHMGKEMRSMDLER